MKTGHMRRAMVIIVGVTIGLAVAVQAAGLLSLDAAMDRASHANAELHAARAEVEAARGRLAQASVLAANPILTTGGTRHSIPGEVNTDSHVSLGQEIMVGGQRGLRMTAARFD